MPYIPKSRIQTNLYTAGGEYLTVQDNQNYIGYYHKTYKGSIFTGKSPDDKPNRSLIPAFSSIEEENSSYKISIFPSGDTLKFSRLKNINFDSTLNSPQLHLTQPTEQDYKLGEFRRYFCKKRNEFTYLEISSSDYNKIVSQDPIIDFTSWFPFNIPWSLTGDKDKVGQTNKNIVLLQINKDKLYGFDKYLKGDYLKYYKA
jgi:hypothetical protein